MTRPFRFGVFGEHARTPEALLATARRAEESGYSTFLIRDHFIEEPFGHQLVPLSSLMAVAGATNRLRVGSLVLSNDYRYPVVLAKEIATLDVLSNGRVELGLRGGPLTFAGKHYAVTRLDGFPKSAQRPRPPLLIGAAGKRMLSIAAREADIVGFQTVSTARGMMSDDPSGRLASVVAQRVEQVRQDAGARFNGIELSMVATVVFAESRHRAAERFARERGWEGVSAQQVLEMPSVFIGSVDCIVDEMRMEAVAPIVARLAGA